MKLTLVSHASVILETAETSVWTDPWLFGTAFNDSWTLCPDAVWNPAQLDAIGFLWISHEHPDHFHLPTLDSLPVAFKRRVTVLFQRGGSEQLADRLTELGFANLRELRHRERLSLGGETWVYSYREGPLNACLAVGDGTQVVLDVNDARLGRFDCAALRRDLGPPAVVLNQFSIAGYGGEVDRNRRLPGLAKQHLEYMARIHERLGAEVTIPFASFMRYAQPDNGYMNDYATRIGAAAQFLLRRGDEVVVLAPGDSWTVGSPHDSAPAITRIERARERSVTPERVTPIPVAQLADAFHALVADLRNHYPARLLGGLQPVTVTVPDLKTQIRFSIPEDRFEESPAALPDLEIRSQPLHFAFSHPFGIQTLGVSARLKLFRNGRNWRRHRVLLSLYQAGVHLRPLPSPRELLEAVPRLPSNLRHLVRRLRAME